MNKYSLWVSGLVALLGSLIVNAIIDSAFFPYTGVPATVMTFKVAGPVGAFTVLGVIGAIIVFAIVRKFSKNPNSVFTWIAIVVLLVSLLPDIFVHHLGAMFAAITLDGAVLLMTLHVACALVTVLALTQLTKPISALASGAMNGGSNL
jgi:hypothetical protein